MKLKIFLAVCGLLSVLLVVKSQELFPVSIIHLNDMHARFDETNMFSNTCKPDDDCIGGYARVITKVKELLSTKRDRNPIYLNVADNFQGTLWYNIYKWNVTSYFLNLLPADAMTIGNHEFDDGVEGLVPFLETINSPILISNIDDSLEPSFQNKYTKSLVITKYAKPIGIVGVTTTFKSNWGKLNILPEVEAVQEEVAKLVADGIKIIIVLSHCGYETDKQIAQYGGPIDIIVGGHSHSFLYSGENPPGPDNPVGSYPSIETQKNGHEVLIVQASAYTKYLGDITLYFDEDGKVQRFEGAPIFLSHDVVPDPEILLELAPWKEGIDLIQNQVVGIANFDISSSRCYNRECGMGELTTDAYVDAFLDKKLDDDGWTGATISLAVPGGIRAGLSKGEIFYGDLVTTTPFENLLHNVELQGKIIREALEFAVADKESLMLLQVSGLRVVYNLNNEANNKIVSLDVLCRVCERDIPRYEPIDDEKFYRVSLPSFLAEGGDGFTMIGENARDTIYGPRDIDALAAYVEKNSPFSLPPLSGRISFI